MALSRCAGILDTYGGLRFVIAHEDTLAAHARHDELLFVVPHLTVQEPVAWEHIPSIVARIESELDAWIDSRPNLDENGALAVKMYRIRQTENPACKNSLNLEAIAFT